MKIRTSYLDPLIFWRLVLTVTGILAVISIWQMLGVAHRLGVAIQSSKTWLVLLSGLGLAGLAGLGIFILTFIPTFASRIRRFKISSTRWMRRLALPALILFLTAYPLILTYPFSRQLIAKEAGVRVFLFWLLALGGTLAFRILWQKIDWPFALGIILLCQSTLNVLASSLSGITDYPFALGWSETSRYYYPALFLSKKIFGQPYPWPILHPSLHLALVPPYISGVPLWVHRAWQVGVRFLLVGLISPAILYRLNSKNRGLFWLGSMWVFLYFLTLPLYLHLAVPVFITLWGFSAHDNRRTWLAIIIASIWAGLSRINWYPVPGMLAAALYLLEVPYMGKGWRYLVKPAVWFIVGTMIAFASMQVYIAFSGIPGWGNFYTSLTSSLLWYRLWPNTSYSLGVLPGIILFSSPLWLATGLTLRQRGEIHPLRLALLFAELLVLFIGGVFVSMKIGGGADLHNMDAYAVLLLVIFAYLFFNCYQPDTEKKTQPARIHWLVVALLFLIPAWFGQRLSPDLVTYDKSTANNTLTRLQAWVDTVNTSNGEILFITQRHLVTMHMLRGVTLVPEYEREELMEMAMANNKSYLRHFTEEIKNHRFAVIVVDPLRFTQVGWNEAMGAENNAWARRVVKPVLCYYEQAEIFLEDRIVIYVPRPGDSQCP